MKQIFSISIGILSTGIFIAGLGACSSVSSKQSDDAGTESTTDSALACEGDDPGLVRPEGWERASHCSGIDPNYDRLFNDEVVHRFDIVVDADFYRETMDDLEDKLSGGGPGGGPGGRPGGGSLDDGEDPIFVPVTLKFEGLTWWQVGMRYKGNSSLHSAWQRGGRKLAFRLNFEMYEDSNPELKNQRFFGFEKMTFSNGFKDPSLIRDKLAADIFRSAGVPAARGAFARVYVDFGEGSTYFGLYTMIEDPSDKMHKTQFEQGGGNLYKPEGDGAKLGSFIEAHFDKKNNTQEADWSDVIGFINALNANQSDAETWRAGLEATFNAAGFLKYLAINQTMVNWDSYGLMSHNYYLYGDPGDSGRLTFFPWDLNEVMLRSGRGDAESVMLDEVSSEWPLIRYLLDDPSYLKIYIEELETGLEGAFAIDAVNARIDAYHTLIAPYVIGPDGESLPYTCLEDPQNNPGEFENALTTGKDALKPHIEARHSAVRQALGL